MIERVNEMDGISCPVCNSRQVKEEKVTGIEHKYSITTVFTLCHCLDCNHWFTVREQKEE